MVWVLLAIISHFFWAVVNVGEKYLVGVRFKNPYIYLLLAFWVGPIVLLLVPFVDFYIPNRIALAWVAAAGVCYFIGCAFYIKAMQIEEVTRINIWWNLIPIFNLVIAWTMIGEKLGGREMAAFVILLISALLASIHFQQVKLGFSKALPLMLFACFFISVCDVIIKHVSQSVPFCVIFIYLSLTFTIASFSFFVSKKFRDDFRMESRNFKWKLLALVIAVTILSKIGLVFNVWALTLGPVALVASMEGFQVIFVFVMAVLLSVFLPRIIKEELDKKNLFLKLLALALMLGGIGLLYI